jgi:ribosomal protein S18 acetylase RimI-like enzyme
MNITGRSEPGDLIPRLDLKYFPRPWKEADWNALDMSQHRIWTVEKSELIGFALFATPQGDETAHLLKIFVMPEQRGSGVATDFWKFITKELEKSGFRTVYLEVEKSNDRARAFYQKLGFKLLREVKSYYSDGEAGLMMQLTL